MTRQPLPPINLTAKDRERFERRIRRTDGCWLWQGFRNHKGYGHFAIHGRDYKAHRVAFELATGRHPGRLLVCHSCDNPPCVNPAHLWLGTMSDNALDMHAKGRAPEIRTTPARCRKCGHHRTDDYVNSRGYRSCRNCVRLRDKMRFAASRAA